MATITFDRSTISFAAVASRTPDVIFELTGSTPIPLVAPTAYRQPSPRNLSASCVLSASDGTITSNRVILR